MHYVQGNMQAIYPLLMWHLQDEGIPSHPRGHKVIEAPTPVMWSINSPNQWAMHIPGRKFNPFFALAEVVWMWSGKGGAEFIKFYNKSITNFLDDGMPYFHGSYGMRVRRAGYSDEPFRTLPELRTRGANSMPVQIDQLEHVISKLQADPMTRQAVVSLWDPIKDNLVKSKDHPCNNMVYFTMRDGRMHMTVIRRSNDLIWGVPYNACQFAHLHALIAGSLDVKMGHQHTVANNLHFYEDLYSDTLDLVTEWTGDTGSHAQPGFCRSMDLSPMDTWNLEGFTNFVTEAWDPLEKKLRTTTAHPSLWTLELHFMDEVARAGVPTYWEQLFQMLMAYHFRKAGFMDGFTALIDDMPPHYKWLVEDFYAGKESK